MAGRPRSPARWSRHSMWRSRPRATFSATVSDGKMRASWKLRPRPSMALRSGPHEVTSTPRKWIFPLSRLMSPDSRSKIVVLPAPLGPMRPRISPGWSENVTSLTARIPPKRFVRPATSMTGWPTSDSVPSSLAYVAGRTGAASPASAWAPLLLAPEPSATEPAPSRNTERRMSPRSSSSAVGPENRTSPFSRKYARSAMVRATLTDCSTRMIVQPWAWIARTILSSSSTMVGARPRDSSSMMSSFGLATKAMPSASCCCSPPERLPASWSQRSARRGNWTSTSSILAWTSLGSSLAKSHVPALKCSSTVSVGNTALPPGTCTMPAWAACTASAWVMSRPSKKMAPPTGSTRPLMALSSVDLPAPFVPRRATISFSFTSTSTPKRIWTVSYLTSTPLQMSSGRSGPPAASALRSAAPAAIDMAACS